MPNLVLEETCGPSHEDIMASNVLAFLSCSRLNSARLPVQNGKELSSSEPDCARFLLQESQSSLKNSSTKSSESLKIFRKRTKGEFFMGLDPISHNCSDLDDDGLHGDRMKPLSSLENNCEMLVRFSMPQFSKRRGSNPPANSKVLAAARLGRRARRKAMYYSDNKENLIMAHMKEMQETCPNHKGVKRKSAGHEGNARFLALKRKRSTLSSWRTMTSVPRITPPVSKVAATASISNCKDVQNFTSSPQRTISRSRQAAHPLLGESNDTESIQGNKIILQESAPCQVQIVAAPCSNFACPESSGLLLTNSREDSSCSSHADPSGKEHLSFTKGDVFIGPPCTKPPTYPKAKQSVSTIHDQASINEAQSSSFKVMEMQHGYAKIEDGSEDLLGHERAYHIADGMNLGDASCSVSHFIESSAGSESCNPQMEMCKLKLLEMPQTLAGPSQSMPSGNKSDSPCLPADKGIILTQPLCSVNAPTVSISGAVVKWTIVKQETISQDSAEMNLDSQMINLNCQLLPGHISTSTREHIKESARKNPPVLHNALGLPSQLGTQKPNDHPRAWGTEHTNVGLLHKFRRGRPPRKSNLCPCPETKEHTDKFARVCAPSGILGKLNPGIITRLRDKKQVHAVLETVIRGAFMTGMKDNLKLQGAKEAEDADAYQGVHGEQKAGCKETTVMKGREAPSDQEFDLKLGLADRKTPHLRDENERQRNPPSRVELHSLNGQNTSSGSFGLRKQEPCLPEHSLTDVNLLKGGSLLISQTYSRDTIMDIHGVSEVHQNKVCSEETLGDQKVVGYNISNAATTNATGNVASCWLELLRLDIKGRLSALRRSRRRVRSVIVSGQLDASKGKANHVDEMEKWRAFFVHMENVLCSEGTRLENWLNQITQMQSSYCQKKSTPSDMPPLCGMDLFNVDMDGASM